MPEHANMRSRMLRLLITNESNLSVKALLGNLDDDIPSDKYSKCLRRGKERMQLPSVVADGQLVSSPASLSRDRFEELENALAFAFAENLPLEV